MTRASAWLSPWVFGLSLAWLGVAAAQGAAAPPAADAPPSPSAAAPVSDLPVQGSGSVQSQASPSSPAPAPQAYPYAEPQPYPYAPGAQPYPYGYPAPPYPYVMVPADSRAARREAKRAARAERRRIAELTPPPVFLWRIAVELGGTLELGRVDHYVDGDRVRTQSYDRRSESLDGAVDFRLTVQRTFGKWFALGGQLGWTNWQSDHLDRMRRLRSNYVALALQPELRLPLGDCRRCPALFLAGRAGVALALRGEHVWQGNGARERSDPGVGAVWGLRGGIELPLGTRVRLRFSTGYEGAFLRNRVVYRDLGSEVLTFRVQRPLTTLGVSVGL